jgi:hypothetical protein
VSPAPLSPPQVLALRKLLRREALPRREDPSGRHGAYIATGINTRTLVNMRRLGLIACSQVFLHGLVSADLVVTPAGLAAAKAYDALQ